MGLRGRGEEEGEDEDEEEGSLQLSSRGFIRQRRQGIPPGQALIQPRLLPSSVTPAAQPVFLLLGTVKATPASRLPRASPTAPRPAPRLPASRLTASSLGRPAQPADAAPSAAEDSAASAPVPGPSSSGVSANPTPLRSPGARSPFPFPFPPNKIVGSPSPCDASGPPWLAPPAAAVAAAGACGAAEAGTTVCGVVGRGGGSRIRAMRCAVKSACRAAV